mmetsp:Transcript_30865/g.42768  ORF Transcript_30865/g.42768 Transcript_30865/m.42768 type:complete len:186 (+) Transcript_30865:642-1199(+)
MSAFVDVNFSKLPGSMSPLSFLDMGRQLSVMSAVPVADAVVVSRNLREGVLECSRFGRLWASDERSLKEEDLLESPKVSTGTVSEVCLSLRRHGPAFSAWPFEYGEAGFEELVRLFQEEEDLTPVLGEVLSREEPSGVLLVKSEEDGALKALVKLLQLEEGRKPFFADVRVSSSQLASDPLEVWG